MLTKADWTKIAADNLKNDAVTAIAGYNKHCLELKKLKTVDSVINAMSSASAFLTASEKCAKELKALSESSDPTLNKQKI